MSIFDLLKNHSDDSAVAVIATIAVQREESGRITAKTAGTATATSSCEKTEIPPGGLGKPVFSYQGHVLAWEADPPHIKSLSWLYANQPPGKRLPIDRARIANDCKLSDQEVRRAIARLINEGDLEPSAERRQETFILRIQYHEDGAQP
jgi:hypothetical protein